MSIKRMQTTLLWILCVEMWFTHYVLALHDESFFQAVGFQNATLFEPRKRCAMFLGSGPSALQHLDPVGPLLKSVDLWTSNFFFLHPSIVPTFYHVELKVKKPTSSWNRRHREYTWLAHFQQNATKRKLYRDVLFFAKESIQHHMHNLNMENTTSYKRRESAHCILKSKASCDQSIQFIISTMVASSYSNIFLLGVDMYTNDYFWTSVEHKHLFEGMHLPDPNAGRWHVRGGNLSVHNNLNCNVPYYLHRLSKGCNQTFVNLSSKSPLKLIMETVNARKLPGDIRNMCSLD